MSTVLTLGSFDLFHRGHVELLRRCKGLRKENRVLVGLNTDRFVLNYKGRRPIVSYEDRRAVLLACRYVDDVMANEQADRSAKDVIEWAQPDYIYVGSDWQDRDYLDQLGVSQEWLDAYAIEVRYVPYTEGISSTLIRERIA